MRSISHPLGDKEPTYMNSTSNREKIMVDMQAGMNEQIDEPYRNMDVEVNIHKGTKSGDLKLIEEKKFDPDLTESSSSFDSDGTSFSDGEVDPELYDDALSALRFDGYNDPYRMRKKKLTFNWRKYVGHLMWRCKWVELQVNKFKSQAKKYDRQIAEYDASKQCEENNNSKSLPIFSQIRREPIMKRKKRRRAEDTEELASYMSHHNLFSYFENKKSVTGVACTDGNWCIEGADAERTSFGTNQILVDEEFLSGEDKDGGSSLEHIFWKIGVMQSKVREMKTRARKVLNEKSVRFGSTDRLSLLVSCDNMLTSSAQNPASTNNNVDNLAATPSSISIQILHDNVDSDTKMVDVARAETAGSKLGEVNHFRENMKSINPLQIRESSSNTSRTLLTYNRRAKMTPKQSKEVNNVPEQMPKLSDKDNQESSIVPSSHEPSSQNMCSMENMMTTTTTSGTDCMKKKRAMRKARLGKWNKRYLSLS